MITELRNFSQNLFQIKSHPELATPVTSNTPLREVISERDYYSITVSSLGLKTPREMIIAGLLRVRYLSSVKPILKAPEKI